MKRRASRPRLEPIEDRVLTTVTGTSPALTHAVRPSTRSTHHIEWMVLHVANQTNRDIPVHIVSYVGHTIVDERSTNIRPGFFTNEYIHVRAVSQVALFTVTYNTSQHHTVRKVCAPNFFDHQPSLDEERASPYRYRFVRNIVRQITLIPPEHPPPPTDGSLGGGLFFI